ncbi:MAG: BatD family protein [Acidobacteriota bacterium]
MSSSRLLARIAVLLLVMNPLLARGEEIEFSAEVDNQKIGMDDTLSLTVTIAGANLNQTINPVMPEMKDFYVAGTSQSSNISFVNGQISASRSIIYTLVPKRTGKFVVPPVTMTYGGKQYSTAPIEVEVVEGSAGERKKKQEPWSPFFDPFESMQKPPGGRRYGPEAVQVVAELDRKQVYQGEQTTLTFKILTKISVTGVQIEEFPPLSGFWVDDLDVDKNPRGRKVTVNGEEYVEFVVKRSALFPSRSGRLTIEPATFAIQAVEDSFFPNPELIRRKSKPLTLVVLPLPEAGRPAGYDGTVGTYSVSAALDRDRVALGEVASLRITVTGRGNLKTISPPKLPPLNDIKLYEPKFTEKIDSAGPRMTGEKTWEYVLSPKAKGNHEIGPVTLAYFDPISKSYQVARTKALNLQAEGGEIAAQGVPLSERSQIRMLRQDIAFIHTRDSAPAVSAPFSRRSAGFYLLLILPPLVNVGLLIYRHREESRRMDVASYLRGRAFRDFRKALKRARARASPAEAKDFYQLLNDGLSRYVAHKLSLSPQGLTLQSVLAHLESRRVDPELLTRFKIVWNDAEFGLFAAGKPGLNSMEKLLRDVDDVVSDLDKRL